MEYIPLQSGTLLTAPIHLNSGQFVLRNTSLIYIYLLNILKACLGAGGMLHFGVADWVGQYPVVSTRTVRSTPPKDTCGKEKKLSPCTLARRCYLLPSHCGSYSYQSSYLQVQQPANKTHLLKVRLIQCFPNFNYMGILLLKMFA